MSNSSDYDLYEQSESSEYAYVYPFGTTWLATVPLILTTISVITIIGNLFVIIAYYRDPRIRANVANLYILNLAISDLLVGSVIMTVNMVWTLKDYWLFGEIFCKLWSTLDHTLSMVSIITILMICWDRYCLVSMGMKYNGHQTHKRVSITLLVMWVVVLVIYSTMAFSWSAITGERKVNFSEECEMEFLTSLSATVVVNFIEFIIPFTILIMINVAVFINIKRRSTGKVGQSTENQSFNVSTTNTEHRILTTEIPHQRPLDGTQGSGLSGTESNTPMPRSQALQNATSSESIVPPTNAAEPAVSELGHVSNREVGNDKTERNYENATGRGKTMARHRKAALVLTVLVGCFAICYLPYNISSVVFSICWKDCVPTVVWEIISNLLWCNSTLNPIIYALTNVHFRRNFRRFLCLDRWSFDFKRCRKTNRNEVTETAGSATA